MYDVSQRHRPAATSTGTNGAGALLPATSPVVNALLARLDAEHPILAGLSPRERLLAAAWLGSYRSARTRRAYAGDLAGWLDWLRLCDVDVLDAGGCTSTCGSVTSSTRPQRARAPPAGAPRCRASTTTWPKLWARIVPVLAVVDVREAVGWYVDVLGLVEHVRIGEGHRAQLGVDGERAEIIVRELRRDERPSGMTLQIMFRVDDVDAVLEAARTAGADADESSRDHGYGERQAGFVDPFGYRWVLTQTLRDVDPEDWGGEKVVPRR